jgi:DNA-binding transcriptional LysR family regulator
MSERIDAYGATMDLNRIAVFARVVEAGSFTAAAQALGVRKSSVSRSVAALEAELGIRLLQRTTRRLSLTDAGRAYHARTRDALEGLEEARKAVSSLGAEARGLVRLTAPTGYTSALAPVIAAFLRDHPGVRVEVSLTARFVDLVKEGFDLAIRGGPLVDSSLLARKIADTEHRLFASPAYLAAAGRPRRLADLARHECLLYRSPGGTARWRLVGPRGEEEVVVHGKVETDEYALAVAMVEAGHGIALGPDALFTDALAAGRLERVLPAYVRGSAPVNVVWPSRRFEPAAVMLLREALVEALPRWHARQGRRSPGGR